MTIKTIKPAGGGDYTTLAAWEDWADGQASADQWAECYSGGDLGEVTLAGWAATPTATLYPKIYTPLAERHQGKDNSTGAYINVDGTAVGIRVDVKYTRIEGIRLELTVSKNAIEVYGPTAPTCIVDSCLVIAKGTISTGYCGIYIHINIASDIMTVRNNIVFCNNKLSYGIRLYSDQSNTGTIPTMRCYNNTVYYAAIWGIYAHVYTSM